MGLIVEGNLSVNSANSTASLNLTNLPTASSLTNILVYNSASGVISYTSSAAIGGSSSIAITQGSFTPVANAVGTVVTTFPGMYTKIGNDITFNCRLTAVTPILGPGTIFDSFDITLPLKTTAFADPYSLILTVNQDATSTNRIGVGIVPSSTVNTRAMISLTGNNGAITNTFNMYLSATYKA